MAPAKRAAAWRRLPSNHDRGGRVVGQPHFLDIVEASDFRPKNVNDHVALVDQHPIAVWHTFDPEIASAGGPEVLQQTLGNGADMAMRTS
jgi:hypothetical protein